MVGQVTVFAFVEPGAVAVKAPHAVFGAGFEEGGNFKEVAVANEIFDGVGGHEDFTFGHAHVEVLAEVEALGDDGDEAIGKLGGNAALDFGGEGADDSLESFGAGGGMDGGENEVTGFRGAECEAHGLGIAHFADHEDIRIFAKGVEQGLLETGGVAADFALADVALLRAERVFDGAFDGEDVARVGGVDFLEQGGERRGFAGTGRAADKNQAMVMVDEFFEIGMEVEFFDSSGERSEQANGKADAASGLENVEAATDAGNAFGEIGGAAFEEMLPLIAAEDATGGIEQRLRRDRFADSAEGAANAHGGGQSGFEV